MREKENLHDNDILMITLVSKQPKGLLTLWWEKLSVYLIELKISFWKT